MVEFQRSGKYFPRWNFRNCSLQGELCVHFIVSIRNNSILLHKKQDNRFNSSTFANVHHQTVLQTLQTPMESGNLCRECNFTNSFDIFSNSFVLKLLSRVTKQLLVHLHKRTEIKTIRKRKGTRQLYSNFHAKVKNRRNKFFRLLDIVGNSELHKTDRL